MDNREIAQLKQQITALASENASLDWEIPSQLEKILDNVDRIEVIETRIRFLQERSLANSVRSLCHYTKMAFDAFYTTPNTTLQIPPPAPTTLRLVPEFTPIRKRHLTLVHSRRDIGTGDVA